MAALIADAVLLFQGGVSMLSSFVSSGGVTAVDVIFTAFVGIVAIGMFARARQVLN